MKEELFSSAKYVSYSLADLEFGLSGLEYGGPVGASSFGAEVATYGPEGYV